MRPLTRRRALRGFVGALACVAGCSGEDGRTGASDQSTTRNPNAQTVTDPDGYVLRVSGEQPVVWRGEGDEVTDENRRHESDAKDTAAYFVRIPDGIDADAIDGYGSQYGNGGCRLPDERRADGHGEGSSSDTVATAASVVSADANAESER